MATESSFTDKELTCKECNAAFTFSAGEQEFYAEKAFENEPSRCKDCRKVKKDARRAAQRERRSTRPRGPKPEGDGPGYCYAFQKGECERGDDCRFQHKMQEA